MNWLNTNFPNWRSFSIGLALAVAYAAHGYLLEGTVHKSTIGVALLIAALGYVVKDKVVTGGSVAQTAEAERRAEPTGTNTNGGKFPPIETKGLSMILFALFFSAGMVFTVAACGKRVEKITNIPPGISEEQVQNWYKATGALAVVGSTTKSASELLIDMNHNGEFPSGDSYQTALSIFGRISQGGITAGNLLSAEPEHFTESVRNQVISFATDALDQLLKLDFSTPRAAVRSPSAATAPAPDVSKVQAQVETMRKALKELQAMPAPSHSDTSELSPMDVLRDAWAAQALMRRAEGMLLIGRI